MIPRHFCLAQRYRGDACARAHLRAISTIQSVSHSILSSLELQEIFQAVAQLLKDTFNYTYVSIYTLNDQVLRLGARAGYPEDMIYTDMPATTGISGRCVQTQKTQFLRDVTSDPAFLRAALDIESEI